MSNIAIHDLSARARARTGRIAQVDALQPQLDRHVGDHWQLNRASVLVPRAARNDRPDYQPWPALADQPILIGVQSAAGAVATVARTIPYPFVVHEISLVAGSMSVGATWEIDVAVNNYGSIWRASSETPRLAGQAIVTGALPYTIKPGVMIPTPGHVITLTYTSGASGAGYLSVVVRPIRAA